MTDATAVLDDLYWRYKEMALRAGAALTLGDLSESLEADAHTLWREATDAQRSRHELSAQFIACNNASEHLYRMLVAARKDEDSASLTEYVFKVRETHKRFRAEVWKVLPCEYAPCSAAHISTEQAGGNRG